MNRSEAFPSPFWRTMDLIDGASPPLTIESVQSDQVPDARGGLRRAAVVTFADSTKRLVLNRPNWDLLEEAFGPESDRWGGKVIRLERVQCLFNDRVVWGLRVRIPTDGTPPKRRK